MMGTFLISESSLTMNIDSFYQILKETSNVDNQISDYFEYLSSHILTNNNVIV